EGRRLAGGAADDEPVGAVVDEVAGEVAELLVVDGAVRVERRHDRRQHFPEHSGILLRWTLDRGTKITLSSVDCGDLIPRLGSSSTRLQERKRDLFDRHTRCA